MADQPDPPEPDTEPEPEPEPDDDRDPEALRRETAELRAEAASLRRKLRKLEQDQDEQRRNALSDEERKLAEARREGEESARRELTVKMVRADIRAAAAGKFADPNDAVLYLDVEELAQQDEADRDLGKLLDKVLEAKPHLAVKDGGGSGNGLRTQGQRSTTDSARAAQGGDSSAWLRKAARSGRR